MHIIAILVILLVLAPYLGRILTAMLQSVAIMVGCAVFAVVVGWLVYEGATAVGADGAKDMGITLGFVAYFVPVGVLGWRRHRARRAGERRDAARPENSA